MTPDEIISLLEIAAELRRLGRGAAQMAENRPSGSELAAALRRRAERHEGRATFCEALVEAYRPRQAQGRAAA